MGAQACRTVAWAWLPTLLVMLFLVGAVRWYAAPTSPAGVPLDACSSSTLESFLGCP
jgi:hypothetical protein